VPIKIRNQMNETSGGEKENKVGYAIDLEAEQTF
jgi:hypothetical protein